MTFERARMFPLVPATSPTIGIAQKSDVFLGTIAGLQGAVGLLDRLDLQAGVGLQSQGASWRVGAKYRLLRWWRLDLAAMAGYSRGAASGTVDYLTAGNPTTDRQSFAASTLDVYAPLSLHVDDHVSFYTGFGMIASSVSGASENQYVEDMFHDLVTNLGIKIRAGIFEGDLEAAIARVSDPFAGGTRMVPFFGGSFGVVF